ncbi:MAG: hypothetical protein NTW95_10925 [Candidatus Aminicenantes bacterium]|nr:hypothetical protein [Candidatus Aminicenantes bacterium]
MTENKNHEDNPFPEPEEPKERPAGTAYDPSQTRLLTSMPAAAERKPERIPDGDAAHGPAEEPGSVYAKRERFKKLTQTQIIWISFSIILVCLILFVLLITQGRQRNKALKPATGENLEETAETGNPDAERMLKNKLARQADKLSLILSDDEFTGQAPMTVKATGPVVSATADPELAAMVDALKIRLQVSSEGKTVGRGTTGTTTSKGEYRGFKISVEEKADKQKMLSEETTVTTPQKGLIRTADRVLQSVSGSDLAQFSAELLNAGLEIIRLPAQPGSGVCKVQFRAVHGFGKPIPGDLLISGRRVGKISLGMPTTQLETILLSSYVVLKRKVLVNDVYYDVYKVLDQSNEPLFFVYENQGRVWGISLISDLFQTEKGIGINSTLGSLRINYPQVKVGLSEKNTPYVKMDDVEGLFILPSEGIDIRKRVFPNNTKIIFFSAGRAGCKIEIYLKRVSNPVVRNGT